MASQFDSEYIDRTHDKPHIDIAKLTIDVLRSRSFREEHIHDSALCTRCSGSMFHSYRRDRTTGRTLALAAH